MTTKMYDAGARKKVEEIRVFFLSLSNQRLEYLVYHSWIGWLIDPADSLWNYQERDQDRLASYRPNKRKLSIIELATMGIERSLPMLGCMIESEETQVIYPSFDAMEQAEGDHNQWSMHLPSLDQLRETIATMNVPELLFSLILLAYTYFCSYSEASYLSGWQPYFPVPRVGNTFASYLKTYTLQMLEGRSGESGESGESGGSEGSGRETSDEEEGEAAGS